MRERFENIMNHYFQVFGLVYIAVLAIALAVCVVVLGVPILQTFIITLCTVVMGSISYPFPMQADIGIAAALFIVGTLILNWAVGLVLVVFFAVSLGLFRLFVNREDQAR